MSSHAVNIDSSSRIKIINNCNYHVENMLCDLIHESFIEIASVHLFYSILMLLCLLSSLTFPSYWGNSWVRIKFVTCLDFHGVLWLDRQPSQEWNCMFENMQYLHRSTGQFSESGSSLPCPSFKDSTSLVSFNYMLSPFSFPCFVPSESLQRYSASKSMPNIGAIILIEK